MERHFENRRTAQRSFRNSQRGFRSSNRNNGPHEHNVGESSRYSRRSDHNYYRHRETPYNTSYNRNRPYEDFPQSNFRNSQPTTSSISPTRDSLPVPLSLEEAKSLRLLNVVKSQYGVRGLLVLLQCDGDNPTVILHNAVSAVKNGVLSVVAGDKPQKYELRLNQEYMTEGIFPNKQAAKSALCEQTLEILKKTCFQIIKKRNYEEISTDNLNKPQSNVTTPTASIMEGSKAHAMMLKMGWGGKGLGVNEQGTEKTVAEIITQNITKEGLGGKNIMAEINNILIEFAKSTKVTTLAFDSGFTKDERALIHGLAAKLNLKSKSEGQGESRRITIAKKISRWDLVKELLLANCENDAYKLVIPSEFEDLWNDL